jgi:hypothetical protein
MSIWQPQPGPQSLAIAAHFVHELMFGGARGGGKSDYLLGDYMQDVEQGVAWRGILFRRTYAELEELITRAKEIYYPVGATYAESKYLFTFPSGATLKMRHLEKARDAAKYQGHQYTWVGWDELTNWADQNAYNMLKACVRSAAGVQNKRIRCSANPGGVGHHWVKQYFVDPCPPGRELIDGKRMFIPSKLIDNKILTENDPEYEQRLRELGSPELVRAWLEGDWNVITGAFFPEFSTARHVIRPFEVPRHWTRFRSGDWGSATPFSFGWWAISDGYETDSGLWIPNGAMVRYREWYGCSKPNVGLRMTAAQVGRGIREKEAKDGKITYGVLDPSAWRSDSGPSVAEQMASLGVYFRKAERERVNGWDQVRNRLVGDPDTGPMMYFFDTCHHTIRTFPALPHDENNAEDVDTDSEDHAGDDIRYACMSRPFARKKPARDPEVKTVQQLTYDELWELEAESASVYVQV